MQDERFSYVILRRGPRPETTMTVSPWSRAGTRSLLGASRDSNGDGKGVAQGPSPGSAPRALLPPSLPPRVVLNQVLLDRQQAAAAAAAAAAAEGAKRAEAAAAAAAPAGPEGAAAEQGPVGPVVAAFASQYPAYGRGLVDRLVVLQVGGCWCVVAFACVSVWRCVLGPGLAVAAARGRWVAARSHGD